MSKCPICDSEMKEHAAAEWEIPLSCKRCGNFLMPQDTLAAIEENFTPRPGWHLVSGFIREQTDLRQEPPLITAKFWTDEVKALPHRPVEKAAKLLSALVRKTDSFGQRVEVYSTDWNARAYAFDRRELRALLTYLDERKFIKLHSTHSDGFDAEVKADGFAEDAGRARSNRESETAFIAMSFRSDLSEAYSNGIRTAVDAAGFRAVRIDMEEHNEDIMFMVLAGIRTARFLVADFTGHRNGVYFEAGFAMGIGIPVIWLVRKDDASGAHFDTEHFNHIRWETADEIRERLSARIEATIGRGPLRPKHVRSR